MRTTTLIAIGLLAAPAGVVSAAETLSLDDETARINYSLGYQIGGDFKRQGVDLNRRPSCRASRMPARALSP